MPWWIWLLLALFMLAMIVIGGVYAFVHGMGAFRSIAGTGMRIGQSVSRMSEPSDDVREPDSPLFTEPLNVTLGRYERAQVELIRRRESRRARHVGVWARWKR